MVSPEHAGERLITVYHRLRRVADERMSMSGLSLARTKVLRQLHRHGPTRQGLLATEFGVVPHSITDIVDALERDGLAERMPDPADRRAKLVALTDKGAAALVIAGAAREHLLNQIFGALDGHERELLTSLLDKLDAAASTLISGPVPAGLDCAAVPDAATGHDQAAGPERATDPERDDRHVIA